MNRLYPDPEDLQYDNQDDIKYMESAKERDEQPNEESSKPNGGYECIVTPRTSYPLVDLGIRGRELV